MSSAALWKLQSLAATIEASCASHSCTTICVRAGSPRSFTLKPRRSGPARSRSSLRGSLPLKRCGGISRAAYARFRGLGYSAVTAQSPRNTAEEVARGMMREWGRLADVLHVHNPTLNKNAQLPAILRHLQEMGITLLPQIHDLAEDGRPSAYYAGEEYPADCHYVVINSRDRDALVTSGLRPDAVHLLPNTVRPLPRVPRSPWGEWPPFAPLPGPRHSEEERGGSAPACGALRGGTHRDSPSRNPDDLMRYDDWRRYATRHELPVRFDQGLHRTLEDLMGEADAAISTSVNEGFGFAFLEPWTAGLPTVGRRLEHVCKDFEREGVRLPYLYLSLSAPLECFDAVSFRERWSMGLREAFRAFNREAGRLRLWQAPGLRSRMAAAWILPPLTNRLNARCWTGCGRTRVLRASCVRAIPILSGFVARSGQGINPFLNTTVP